MNPTIHIGDHRRRSNLFKTRPRAALKCNLQSQTAVASCHGRKFSTMAMAGLMPNHPPHTPDRHTHPDNLKRNTVLRKMEWHTWWPGVGRKNGKKSIFKFDGRNLICNCVCVYWVMRCASETPVEEQNNRDRSYRNGPRMIPCSAFQAYNRNGDAREYG